MGDRRNAQGTAGRGTSEGVTSVVARRPSAAPPMMSTRSPACSSSPGRLRRLCRHRSSRPAGPCSERTGPLASTMRARPGRPAGPSRPTTRARRRRSRLCLPAGPRATSSSVWPTHRAARPRSTRRRRSGSATSTWPAASTPATAGRPGTRTARSSRTTWPGLGRQQRHPGLPVLPAPPVEPGGRGTRPHGTCPTCQSHHHDGLVQRPEAVLRRRRRLDPGGAPRRAGPVGLHRAADRDRRRRDDRPGLGRQLPAMPALGDLPNTAVGLRPRRSSGCATSSPRT